jgi:hypothetical protein
LLFQPGHRKRLANIRGKYEVITGGLCSVTGQDVLPEKTRRKPGITPNPLMTKLDDEEQFYRDTESIAFPKLDDQQLASCGAMNWCTKRASVILD